MSHKTRLTKLEKLRTNDKLWAFIGIGRPVNVQQQRALEIHARDSFYASGGDKAAYIAFLPFDSFPTGFLGYVKQSKLATKLMNKSKNPAEPWDSQAYGTKA
jgi:hypothetical protein